MKNRNLKQEKERSAFKSLYPYLVKSFGFTDSEIDFYLDHPIFNYRLYVCNCLCEICSSFPSLLKGVSNNLLFKFCYSFFRGSFFAFLTWFIDMKTFYKCLDNSACIDVRSDSGRIVHACCFIRFENKGYVRPLQYTFHNFDLNNAQFFIFMRTVSNMRLDVLLRRCEFREVSLDPELNFELG